MSTDLKRIQNYQLQEQIGSGSFGNVYRAIRDEDNMVVAIKKIKNIENMNLSQSTLREINALTAMCGNPFIIQLIQAIFTPYGVYLVFPLYEMNLYEYLQQSITIDYKSLFKNLLLGVQQIHNKGYIHRDLKPINILMDGDVPRIADFGMVRSYYNQVQFIQHNHESLTHEVFTLHYRPPENLLGSINYNQSSDMWSLGCILSQIVTGNVLFPGSTQIEMLFKIFKVLGTPSALISPQLAKLQFFNVKAFPRFFPQRFLRTKEYVDKIGDDGCDLISQMLQLDPDSRINIDEALEHIYFQ